jgi:alpha-beta hydrolase superfamily lysophospholipase
MDERRQRTLQELQRDLQTIQPADPLIKDRIDRLNDEVNRVINDPTITGEAEVHSLQHAIQEAIESFEGHHPDLTEALRIAINTLVNAGI